MKTLKTLTVVIFGIIIGLSSVQAQEAEVGDTKSRGVLTDAQREMIKDQRKEVKENKETFKETLSDDQKAILENKDLTREERRANLVASFTDEQKAMIAEGKQNMKEARQAFRETITDEQKEQIRTRRAAAETAGKDPKTFRERIKDRVRGGKDKNREADVDAARKEGKRAVKRLKGEGKRAADGAVSGE